MMESTPSSHWIMTWALTALATLVAKLTIDKYLSLRKAFRTIASYPGRRIQWLDPMYSLSVILAPIFPRPGSIGYYGGKLALYKEFGTTVFATVKFMGSKPYFWLADVNAIKAVTSDRFTFRKDAAVYEALDIYGKNLVSSEMADWKRHRAVAAPAFSEANNALVWTETARIINDWFMQLEADQARQSNSHLSSVELVSPMTQITLLVISAAGFGRRVSWSEDSSDEPPPGYMLTYRMAVMLAVQNVFLRILTPRWFAAISPLIKVPYLSARVQATRLAYKELRRYMLEIVSSARASVTESKASRVDAALLKNLVLANMSQEGQSKSLSDDELLSNIFTFLLAGHETSAHSLSFAIAMLALYPEAQQKIYDEVTALWPEYTPTSNSVYKEDYPKLEYTMAFFRETLRLYPSEPRLAKEVEANAVLPAQRLRTCSDGSIKAEGEPFSIAVPAGSTVIIDVWAIHTNPLYWGPDVNEFKPERFLDSGSYRWPRDAYLPFSAGARACIGQYFALTESICILAHLVRRYEVLVPGDLSSKSHEEQKEALLKWTTGVTITPTNARVGLRRRDL